VRRQERGQDRRGGDDLLEVVEQEEDPAAVDRGGKLLLQGVAGDLAGAERLGDRRQDQRLVGDGAERDEGDAVRERRRRPAGYLDRQPRLADAAGTGQGQQADVLALQEVEAGCDLSLAANERSQGLGQIVRIRRRSIDLACFTCLNDRFDGPECAGPLRNHAADPAILAM
jgi:hypothetical protein